MKRRISLILMASINQKIVGELKKAISDTFGTEVKTKNAFEEPTYAYNSLRRQYLSTAILEMLAEDKIGEEEKVLGITDKDLYAGELNFVFGEAYIDGKVAVISAFRLNPELYGKPYDEKIFMERISKEAVHELGHTYGLFHCPNTKCVMHFSNSLADTDKKEANFCSVCQTKLKAAQNRIKD